MAVEHFYDAVFLYGEYDLSADHNELTLERKADMVDVTTFGQTTRKFISGLDDVTLSGSGFVDFDDSGTPLLGVDGALQGEIGQAAKVASLAHSQTDGSVARVWQSVAGMYSPVLAVADAGKFSVELKSAAKIGRGALIMPPISRTVTGTGTVTLVGALAAGETLAANLHVIEWDGTTLDVELFSNDTQDTVTPTSQGNFTQATGLTSEQITVAGAVTDTYWYVSWTFVGTSFKAAVAVGIY